MNKDISKKLMLTAGVKTADWKTYNLNSLELHNELCEMIVQETIKKNDTRNNAVCSKKQRHYPPYLPFPLRHIHTITTTPTNPTPLLKSIRFLRPNASLIKPHEILPAISPSPIPARLMREAPFTASACGR